MFYTLSKMFPSFVIIIMLLPFVNGQSDLIFRANAWTWANIPKPTWECVKNNYHATSLTMNLFGDSRLRYVAPQIHDAVETGFDHINGWIAAGLDCGPASGVYDQVFAYLEQYNLTMNEIWIDAMRSSTALIWGPVVADNIKYLKELVVEGQKRGHAIGILTTRDSWWQVTAESVEFAHLPLWNNDFDYKPYGGWKNHAWQSIGPLTYCGQQVVITAACNCTNG